MRSWGDLKCSYLQFNAHMFQNLTDRLSRVVKTMRGQARLTEENTAEMLREVRLALLEADVALPVVKELGNSIKPKFCELYKQTSMASRLSVVAIWLMALST